MIGHEEWDKLPYLAKEILARWAWQERHHQIGLAAPEKPRIVVLRAQGRPLMVSRIGERFISSFTWDLLMYKAVHGFWQPIAPTTLADRLLED